MEHAQAVLKTLFDTLLANTKPPLIISNFQGDAILSYSPEVNIKSGQTLLKEVENLYFAFIEKIENMNRVNTCVCKACQNVVSLDLKMFVHYGSYFLQDLGGKQELSGGDVILIHRLMKNSIREKTGVKAYAVLANQRLNRLD